MRVGDQWIAHAHRILVDLHEVVVTTLQAWAEHAVDVVFQQQDGIGEEGFLLRCHVTVIDTNIHVGKAPLIVWPMECVRMCPSFQVHHCRQSR